MILVSFESGQIAIKNRADFHDFDVVWKRRSSRFDRRHSREIRRNLSSHIVFCKKTWITKKHEINDEFNEKTMLISFKKHELKKDMTSKHRKMYGKAPRSGAPNWVLRARKTDGSGTFFFQFTIKFWDPCAKKVLFTKQNWEKWKTF